MRICGRQVGEDEIAGRAPHSACRKMDVAGASGIERVGANVGEPVGEELIELRQRDLDGGAALDRHQRFIASG